MKNHCEIVNRRNLIPYSRDCDKRFVYNEGYTILCSKHPESILEAIKDVGYSVDFLLLTDEVISCDLPLITTDLIIKRFSHAKLLIDDDFDKEDLERIRKQLKETEVSIINIRDLYEKCPKKECECTVVNLYIDAFGDVYPCPKSRIKHLQKITNIESYRSAEDLVDFIPAPCVCKQGYLVKAKNPLQIEKISIEFGSSCSSQCIHCYQRHMNAGKKRFSKFNFAKLEKFLDKLEFKTLRVGGGEVLVQDMTLDFLLKYKRKRPTLKYVLKTNGFSDKYDLLGTVFNDVTISLNGFWQPTISTVMGETVGMERIKRFCEEAVKRCDHTALKYLLTPLSINDFPDFLLWAIGIKPQEISVTKAMVKENQYDGSFSGTSLKGLNMAYWAEVFERLSKRINKIMSENNNVKAIKFRFGMGADKLFNIKI